MLNKKIGLGLILMALMVGSSIASVSAILNEIDITGRANFQIQDKTVREHGLITQFADLKFYQGDSVVKEYKNLNLTSAYRGTVYNSWPIFYGETIDDVTGEAITPPEGTTSYEVYSHTLNLASGKIPINEKFVKVIFENSKIDINAERREHGDWIAVKPHIDLSNPLRSSFVAYTVPDTAYDYVVSLGIIPAS
ncbi:MAG: hypothetical protein LBT66_01110 [Methanobrevibacter sp.]|jgi:hypothetical protein|nr:hypothetical protein [Candidatus Methanovirga meridionalis]